MCACDRLNRSVGGTRLPFTLYSGDSGPKFTTEQTPFPNQCNMAESSMEVSEGASSIFFTVYGQ